MGEESNLLAQDNEEEAKMFLEKICKWDLLVSNFDLKEKESARKKYGVDHVFNSFDPFMNQPVNILVECKYREDNKNVTKKNIWEMISTLKTKIDVSKNSPSWNDTSFSDKIHSAVFKSGVIFLKINHYDHNKYKKELNLIPLYETEMQDPPIIGVLSNYRILKITELVQNKNNLEFFYPAYGKNLSPRLLPHISFSYLFSDVIAGKYLKNINGRPEEVYFILSFEKPSKESVNYIRNAARLWNIYDKLREIYFTEGSNTHIQEHTCYKTNGDKFDIKIINGDLSLDFKMEDKINAIDTQ